jgi:hypothetical protein
MSFVTVGVVKYYSFGDYFVVGDNETFQSGITNPSYSGEIVIQERIEGKEVREIGYEAFRNCFGITKVIIYPKITNINTRAFYYCSNITYMNIPSTVTFVGWAGLYLCNSGEKTGEISLMVEFNEGRTEKIYLDGHGIAGRRIVSVLYPSKLEPLYNPNYQFKQVETATICAYSVFSFCGKFQTVTDMSKCPLPQFKPPSNVCATFASCINLNIPASLSIMIILSH